MAMVLILVAAFAMAMYHYDTPFPVDAMRFAARSTWTIDSVTFREDSVLTVARILDLIRRHNGLEPKPLAGPLMRPRLSATLHVTNRIHRTLLIDSITTGDDLASRGLFIGRPYGWIPDQARDHSVSAHERIRPMAHDSIVVGIFRNVGLDSLYNLGRQISLTVWSDRETVIH